MDLTAILAGTPSDPHTIEQLQDWQGPNQDSKATSDNELAAVAGTIDRAEHTCQGRTCQGRSLC